MGITNLPKQSKTCMEIFALSLISVAIVIFTSFFAIRRNSNSDVKLPPGSFGWPFIGESFEFLFGKQEYFVGHRMKKYSPDIFKTKILGEKTAVICGPNGHKLIFSNEDTYFTSFRPHSMQRLFRSYKTKSPPPPSSSPAEINLHPQSNDSKTIRQPGFFKPEALSRYLGKMESISAELLERHWQGKDKVEVYPLAKTVSLTLACQFFLGSNNPERIASLVNHFDDISLGMHSIILNIPGTIFYRANKAAAEIRKELLNVIKDKKEAIATGGGPMMDILSHMIGMTDSTGKQMPENEVADKIMGLLVGGYSTVGTTITFLMKYVGENPDVYDRIRTEQMEIADSKKGTGEVLQWEDMLKMKYTWNVICETLRLNPPLQGTFREVLTEFTYAGYTVPKGWKVYWTVSSTNMNPTYFKNPERFDPSRFDRERGEIVAPYTYVPFGGGPRLCPGKEYARLAILTFIHNAVKKYKWEVFSPEEKLTCGLVPTPEKGLPIRLHHL